MPPNVLIIGVETCRQDAIEPYNPNRKTPCIKAFSEKSMVFDNYITTANNTYQSWGCFFSGKYAHNHGIGIKQRAELKVKLMDEIFQDNGYYVCTENKGTYKPMGSEVNCVQSEGAFREPFLCFLVGEITAHAPYGLEGYKKDKFSKEALIEAHGKCMEQFDGVFQGYLERFGEYKNTIIIFVADHGEWIRDGYGDHCDNINDDTIRVPFIMYHPEMRAYKNSNLFSSVDVLPTLLGLCGLSSNEQFDGYDLSKQLLSYSCFPERAIQIGPNAMCKDVCHKIQGNPEPVVTQGKTYSRKEVLARYQDYKNRTYVNELFAKLESENFFSDEWNKRSESLERLSYLSDKYYIGDILSLFDICPDMRILDAGAGTGIITKDILSQYQDVEIIAVDQCFSMLKGIPEDIRVKKYVADIVSMQFIPDNSIDRIICRQVIHSEIDRADIIINEFRRVLKPKGLLMISEGIPMDDSILDFYKDILSKKESRDMITEGMLREFMTSFNSIVSYRTLLKKQSIKEWLDNSFTDAETAEKIITSHRNATNEVKQKINMVEEGDDIFCDFCFITFVGSK